MCGLGILQLNNLFSTSLYLEKKFLINVIIIILYSSYFYNVTYLNLCKNLDIKQPEKNLTIFQKYVTEHGW